MPAPGGDINPLVLVAADLAGVDEIYRVGGAQAVAALAYGTETIRPVAKIVGPGNAYVAAAKRQVFGTVGIDMIAGPSEVLVVADGGNDPDWIAADLLAQAEHDAAAQSILITDDAALADAVEAAVERQLQALPRAETAAASWRDFGAVIIVERLADCAAARRPHRRRASRARGRRPGGASCRGSAMPARCFSAATRRRSIGDYVGRLQPCAADGALGPLLVRPVGARFHEAHARSWGSAPSSCGALAPAAIALAEAEGLDAHARSVAIRLNR